MTEPYPESLTEGLIPPCVAAYRFNMNIGGSLVLPSPSDPFLMTVCIGDADPWCEGGYIEMAALTGQSNKLRLLQRSRVYAKPGNGVSA